MAPILHPFDYMGNEVKNGNFWGLDWVSQGLDYASQKTDELKKEAEKLQQQAIAEKDRLLAAAKELQASAETAARATLEQGRKFVGELSSSAATAATQTAKQAARIIVGPNDVRDAATVATVMVEHYAPPLVEGLSDPTITANLVYHAATRNYLGLTNDVLSIPTHRDPSFTAFGVYLLAGSDKAATAVMMNYNLPTMEMAKEGDLKGIAEMAYDGFTGNYINAGVAKLGWTAVNFVVGGLFSLADFPYYAANLPNQAQDIMTTQLEELATTGDASLVEVKTDGLINSTFYLGAEILDTTHGYAGIDATGHFLGNIKDIADFGMALNDPLTWIQAAYESYLEGNPIEGFKNVYLPTGSDAAKSLGEMVMYDPNLRWDVATVQVAGAITGFVGSILLGKAKGGAPKATGVRPTATTQATAPKSSPKPTLETTPLTTRPAANSLWTPKAAKVGLRAFDDYVAKLEKADHILDQGVANNFIGQIGNFMDQFPAEIRRTFAEAQRNLEKRVRNLTEDLILEEEWLENDTTQPIPFDEAITEQIPPREPISRLENLEPTNPSISPTPARTAPFIRPNTPPTPTVEGTGPMPSPLGSARPSQEMRPGFARAGLTPSDPSTPSVTTMDVPPPKRGTSTTPPPRPTFETGQVVFDENGVQYYLIKYCDEGIPRELPAELIEEHPLPGEPSIETAGPQVEVAPQRNPTIPNLDTSGNTVYYDSTGHQVGFLDGKLVDAESLVPVTDTLLYETPPGERILPVGRMVDGTPTSVVPTSEAPRTVIPTPSTGLPEEPPVARNIRHRRRDPSRVAAEEGPRTIDTPRDVPVEAVAKAPAPPAPPPPPPNVRAVVPGSPPPPRGAPPLPDHLQRARTVVPKPASLSGIWQSSGASGPMVDIGLGRNGQIARSIPRNIETAEVTFVRSKGKHKGKVEVIDVEGQTKIRIEGSDGRSHIYDPTELSTIRPEGLDLTREFFPDVEDPQIRDLYSNRSGLQGERKWVDLDLTDPRTIQFIEDNFKPIRDQLKAGTINKATAAKMAYDVIVQKISYDLSRITEEMPRDIYSLGDFTQKAVCNEMAMWQQVAYQYLGIKSTMTKGMHPAPTSIAADGWARHVWVDITDPQIVSPKQVIRVDPARKKYYDSSSSADAADIDKYVDDTETRPILRHDTVIPGESLPDPTPSDALEIPYVAEPTFSEIILPDAPPPPAK